MMGSKRTFVLIAVAAIAVPSLAAAQDRETLVTVIGAAQDRDQRVTVVGAARDGRATTAQASRPLETLPVVYEDEPAPAPAPARTPAPAPTPTR
jgi:hypothetical protein